MDYSSQKKINTVEKPLMDLHRRRHREYLDYGWNTNKIAGEKKEKYYPALNEAPDMIQWKQKNWLHISRKSKW